MSTPQKVTIELPHGALAGWPTLVDALRRAEKATGLHMVFGGLIEQIEAQTPPPKPKEPRGIGAVVEDADGRRWIKIDAHSDCNDWTDVGANKYRPSGGMETIRHRYCDISAVRVLSAGVA